MKDNKLLIVVDMQNDFVDGALGSNEAQEIIPNVVKKIQEWDGDIIATLDTHQQNYLDTNEGKHLPVVHCVFGTKGHKLNKDVQAALDSKEHYTPLAKPTFGSTKLPEIIENAGIEYIEVIGLCTDICVVSNALLLKANFPETTISVEEVNNKQQDVSFDSQIAAETQKRTTIYYNNIVVTYQLSTHKSVWLYANVTDYKSLVTNSLVSSAVKSSSKTLSDEDATNRSKIEPLVANYLQNSLNDKYGKDTVIINKVVIKDADFEKSYNEAIAAKQKAQLQSEKQAIENEKNIAKAEADAKVKKTKAQAEADAKLIKAEATAKSNKLLEKSLTSEILQQLYLEKWDGKLPTYMTGDNSSVLFNAGK